MSRTCWRIAAVVGLQRLARAIREDLDDAEQEIIRRIPEVLRKLQP